MNPVENIQQASTVVEGLIRQVQSDQMAAPTCCKEWKVADLIEHVIGGANMFGAARAGRPPAELGEITADNAADQYRTMVDTAVQAFSADGALETPVQMPFGEMPGAMVASLLFADQLTHAWDLARATGQELNVDDALAQQALGVWQMGIQPAFRDGNMFGAEQQVPDGAPLMDQVAAFSGRQV